MTETLDALAMITKADVSSDKVVVGLRNYGRQKSGATPGRCTKTAGLLADAEIYEIIDKDSTAQYWYDEDSSSNILVYDSVQWVAYMNSTLRDSRTSLYKEKNMGGVVEWAIDLEEFESTPTTSLPTSTPPAVSISASPTAGIDGAINPYLYTCTNEQKKLVTPAWEEADQLAKGNYEWRPGGKWQDAMTLYLGSKPKDDYSWVTGKGHLMKNIEREFLIHEGWWTQPPAFTYGYYQAKDVVDLAVKDQTKASNNAESYAQAAMAIYLQQAFHLSSPPTPAGYGTSSDSSVSIAGTEILETYLDAPPSWWEAPVANTSKTFKPDMTDITMMSGVGSLTGGGPFPSCVDGLYEDMEQSAV
ncbi:hypothetical protein N7468_008894 [Penicillium chermesinum]|uniref:GH18 domain-containing protein n=1 Tax=Penicillium chermesinum TaxID=63820 RepID=A0A9W9NGQ2_9EURO|nr:uncharacterized protein N7468_008894 [Penicillium chermesinum]KAJ5219690.1 hypothetical protein N7468_008894 [Penicillium chermesinum]KAJ6153690.1 hypothetical protein N7470_006649 [Penicillium chermesinum]